MVLANPIDLRATFFESECMGLDSEPRTPACTGALPQWTPVALSYAGKTAMLGCAYYAAVRYALALSGAPGIVHPLWLPAATALAICLLFGRRMTPGIWLGAALAFQHTPFRNGAPDTLAALAISGASALGTTVAVSLIAALAAHARKPPYLSGIFQFAGAAALGGTIAPTLGLCALLMVDQPAAQDTFPGWLSWWIADAIGMSMAVPLVIAVKGASRRFGWNKVRDAERHYRTLVELCPDAMVIQQDDRFSFANRAAAALFGTANAEQLIGRSMRDFVGTGRREDAHRRIEAIGAMQRKEEKIRRADGREIHVDIHAAPFMHQGRVAVLLMLRDITALKRSAEELAYLAHYDALTGLPNRALFHQRLDHALRIAARPGRSLELLFLDLDHFKEINDTLGHAAGDLVLKETAQRLQAILRESDTVARLGGDEFVVLVENVDEPHRGGTIATKILAAMASPLESGEHYLRISTSIGISHSPADGADADTLLKKADIAMYRAKQSGRNGYRYYSDDANADSSGCEDRRA